MPATRAAEVIGRQLLRSATSVGANYRASRRARCRPDFVNKRVGRGIDPTLYSARSDDSSGLRTRPTSLELLVESGILPHAKLADLMGECDEITAIIVASIRTAKRR